MGTLEANKVMDASVKILQLKSHFTSDISPYKCIATALVVHFNATSLAVVFCFLHDVYYVGLRNRLILFSVSKFKRLFKLRCFPSSTLSSLILINYIYNTYVSCQL